MISIDYPSWNLEKEVIRDRIRGLEDWRAVYLWEKLSMLPSSIREKVVMKDTIKRVEGIEC